MSQRSGVAVGVTMFAAFMMILIGSFRWDSGLTVFAASGVILSAVYMLWMFQRVNYGPLTNAKNRTLPDLTPREWALVVPTIALAILMGILPNIFLKPMEPSVARLIDRVTTAGSSRARLQGSNATPTVTSERAAAQPASPATSGASGANHD